MVETKFINVEDCDTLEGNNFCKNNIFINFRGRVEECLEQ